MTRNVALLLFSLTFFLGCSSSVPSGFLYPAEKSMEVRYLCRLPYLDATAPHQSWSKSATAWVILNEKKVIVYFKNDRTFSFPRTSEITLLSGKYRCTI